MTSIFLKILIFLSLKVGLGEGGDSPGISSPSEWNLMETLFIA